MAAEAGGSGSGASGVLLEGEAGKSGRHIALHPLALVTICDHCTRVKVGGSQQPADSRILGILFGVQDGLRVNITDAFELQYEVGPDGALKIPPAYVNEKRELHAAVNKDAEVMGWYSVGTEISPGDLELHRAMAEWNESPIYLLLNPAGSAENSKELPLQLYESELHVVNEVPTMLFVSVPFQLEAAEAERISVEHVVKATPAEYGAGGLATSVDLHVDAVKASLAALVARLRTVLRALEAMQAGAVQPDHKLLRQIGTLCHLLPAAGRGMRMAVDNGDGSGDGSGDNDEFARAFLGEYSDGLLVTYLAAVSKLTSLAQEATGKFALAFADAGAGGGGSGMGAGGGGGWHPHSHHPHASSGPSSHRAQGGAAGGGRSRR